MRGPLLSFWSSQWQKWELASVTRSHNFVSWFIVFHFIFLSVFISIPLWYRPTSVWSILSEDRKIQHYANYLSEIFFRYTQMNIQYSSGDSVSMLNFCHNRPRDMAMHIEDRMTQVLGSQQITEASSGTFKVTSEADKGSYAVTLGSSSTLPSCSCEDWKRNRLPCKHFCACFKAGWTWDDLCSQYKNNPLFVIDPTCFHSSLPASRPEEEPLQVQDNSQGDEDVSDVEDCEAGNKKGNEEEIHGEEQGNKILPRDDAQHLQQRPAKFKTKETINRTRRRCIELLKAMSDTIFFVDNEHFLQNLEITLEDVAMEVKEQAPHDKRMAINTITKRIKRKSSGGVCDAAPMSKRIKHPYADMLGVSDKIMRKQVNVKALVHVAKTNSLLSGDQSHTADLQHQLSMEVDEVHLETPEKPVSGTWCKIGATVLTLAEEDVLQTGQSLNDKHINASHCLLREEFPIVEGLNDSEVLRAAKVQAPAATDVIQIHRVGQHWLVSAAVRSQVQVYDSLLPGSCTPLPLRRQLAVVYRRFCRGPDGIFDVQVKCTQKQQRAADCGLFAIANAVSLASGIDPADIQYNQSLMRTHLHTCLTKGRLKMFPHTQRKSKWIIAERHEILSKYCICHQYQEKSEMVQCYKCLDWYHCSCVNVSANMLPQIMTNMYCCPQCSCTSWTGSSLPRIVLDLVCIWQDKSTHPVQGTFNFWKV